MSKPNTKCRVCGKEYFCCSDSKKNNSWKTMACSYDCFQEYMNRIEKSRNSNVQIDIPTKNKEEVVVPKMRSRKNKYIDQETVNENIIED